MDSKHLTCNNPVFPRNEATSSNGNVRELECLDDRLRNVRPDVDVSYYYQSSVAFVVPRYPYRCIRL